MASDSEFETGKSRGKRSQIPNSEVVMRRISLFVLTIVLFAGIGRAQESAVPRATVHTYFGGGGVFSGGEGTRITEFGGGGEGRIYKGLGAGVDIGYLYPRQGFKDGFGLFSTNGYYHFDNGSSTPKVTPFVTAGYSLAFRGEHANLANFGGGVDFRIMRRGALRLEVRDHLWPESGPNTHFLSFRVGLVGWSGIGAPGRRTFGPAPFPEGSRPCDRRKDRARFISSC